VAWITWAQCSGKLTLRLFFSANSGVVFSKLCGVRCSLAPVEP